MAGFRNLRKNAIILAIDIGKNSLQQDSDGITYFKKSIDCVTMMLKRKIFNESKDQFALILFGSSHTINHLSSQECYDNIEVVAGFKVASWDLVKRINKLSPTNITHSDWISTFVLAADVHKNVTQNRLFTRLQIIMFSNLATNISFENVDIIATCLKLESIRLTIIGKTCDVEPLNPALDVFIKKTKAIAVNFKLVMPKLSYYKQKEVIAKAWKAPLIFGKIFSFRVLGYKKIDVTTPRTKWLFNKNYDTQYSTTRDNSDEEDLTMEDDFFEYHSPKCLEVLGFTKTTNAHRSVLMEGGSFIFKPHKEDIITFNAIFQYMVEREEVMLVRKIDLYINLMNVGILFPQEEDDEKFFVFVKLPYVDSEHVYQLPSTFEVLQIACAENADNDENEFEMPEIEYNAQLQSLYDRIIKKIIPFELLTKIIPKPMKDLINSPESIMENAVTSSNQEVPEVCFIEDDNSTEFIDNEELDAAEECVITVLNPIEDFNKHLKNGFNSAIVCKKMQYITLNLIESSKSQEDLMKPLSTLKVLREYYIENNDVKSYNTFMHLVKDAVLISGKEDMWSKFTASGIGLITKQEKEASDISPEKLEEFVTLPEDIDNDIIIDDDNPLRPFL